MRTMILAVAVVAMLVPAGCARNVATGRMQFNNLSREQEIELGREAKPQLTESYGGEVPDAYLRDYVSNLGMTLVQGVEEPYRDLPWEFTLLDSDVINAFALPGGKVFMSRGLMEKMTNEAQLAGVLGHEIGHVTAEHADQQISRQTILGVAAAAGAIAAGASDEAWVGAAVGVAVSGAGTFNLKFGRDEELEADSLGIRYMTRAGYNPVGQLQVMEILREASAGAPPEWLSTHPAPDTRIRRIEQLLDTDYAYTQNNPEYGTYEERFRANILSRLSALPAPAGSALAEAVGSGCWCSGCSGR